MLQQAMAALLAASAVPLRPSSRAGLPSPADPLAIDSLDLMTRPPADASGIESNTITVPKPAASPPAPPLSRPPNREMRRRLRQMTKARAKAQAREAEA